MWSLSGISSAIDQWLNHVVGATWAPIIGMVMVGVAVISLFAILGLVLVIMERKVSAWMQIRLGPNRVGPKGMLQSLADTVKLLVKEGMTPDNADKFLFNLAPFIAMIAAMLLMAPIAFAKDFQIWDINIGVLYITAISSISVIGILMAGWASNNKYSLLGAMRSGAQIVSYELSAGLAILTIVVLTGSLQVSDIIKAQENGWWIFKGLPTTLVAFVIYMIAATAETNRAPFDLAEAESELTAGFHTEYSGMKFALFFLGEYANMIASSAMMVTLFFGGWQPLWGATPADSLLAGLSHIVWFVVKLCAFMVMFIWVRWMLPRFRYDQLMDLGWRTFIPLALGNILVTAIVMALPHLNP